MRQTKFGRKRTLYVLILTLTAMVVEIVSGTIFGSMALLADGWHMGTHAAAFVLPCLRIVMLGNMLTVTSFPLAQVRSVY